MTGSDLENLARSLKRFTAIHGKGDFALIEALRAYAVMTATTEKTEIFEVLLAQPQELVRRLMAVSELELTQHDVGTILGKDQATISRWLKSDISTDQAVVHAE
jgi:glycosyltransferase A (GT-A) superfamily protein (DUF2064 family)